jgi:acylphosphatase
MAKIIEAHVLISGRVQGVFFRVWIKRSADALNLTGWVKNTQDNKVEAVFQGPKHVVDQLIKACHSGPPLAKVKNIEVKYEKLDNIYPDFELIF